MGSLDKSLTPQLKSEDSYVRFEAVKKLNEKELLADVAKNDSNSGVRYEAVRKISDEYVLAEVAKKDSWDIVRREAFKKINDESILADVAKASSDKDIRFEAFKKISDESLLADIAKSGSYKDIRFEAVRKISDEYVLAEVAKKDSWDIVRREAVRKIIDEFLLADIAKTSEYEDVRFEAFKRNSAILKEYGVNPNDLQNIAAVNNHCSDFTVIAIISDIFGSVNNDHFIRIKDNSEIRMIIQEDELKNIKKGNYYIMTHIDCGYYNGSEKLMTTKSTTFTPLSETDAKKFLSYFPKKRRARKRTYNYGTRIYSDDEEEEMIREELLIDLALSEYSEELEKQEFISSHYYDPYDRFSDKTSNLAIPGIEGTFVEQGFIEGTELINAPSKTLENPYTAEALKMIMNVEAGFRSVQQLGYSLSWDDMISPDGNLGGHILTDDAHDLFTSTFKNILGHLSKFEAEVFDRSYLDSSFDHAAEVILENEHGYYDNIIAKDSTDSHIKPGQQQAFLNKLVEKVSEILFSEHLSNISLVSEEVFGLKYPGLGYTKEQAMEFFGKEYVSFLDLVRGTNENTLNMDDFNSHLASILASNDNFDDSSMQGIAEKMVFSSLGLVRQHPYVAERMISILDNADTSATIGNISENVAAEIDKKVEILKKSNEDLEKSGEASTQKIINGFKVNGLLRQNPDDIL